MARKDKDKDKDTAETDAVVVEGTVDDPPVGGDAPSTSPPPTPAYGGASYGGTSPAAADRHAAEGSDPFEDRPELFVAGAFVGGIVLAKLIGAFSGDDD
jgi:hypothetical protein